MARPKGGSGHSSQSGGSQDSKKASGKQSNGNGANGEHIKAPAQEAIAMLKADHRKVEKLFASYESADESKKADLAKQICQELIVHTKLEEEIFYPAVREKADKEDKLDEAQVEHDSAKSLIAELLDGEPSDEFYEAKVKVLSQQIKHHVAEEEAPDEGVFAIAEKKQVDLDELGQELAARKEELLKQLGSTGPRPPRAVSFTTHPEAGSSRDATKETAMASQYSGGYRDRDARGRFIDEDDRDRGQGRRGGQSEGASGRRNQYGQSRYTRDQDEDLYGGRYGAPNDRNRDEEGRFASGNRGGRSQGGQYQSGQYQTGQYQPGQYQTGGSDYRYQMSNRDQDYTRSYQSGDDRNYGREDDRRGGGRGWYGDSQGHSQAARRGWDERDDDMRSGGRTYGRDDDRRSSSYRERDEEGRFASGNGGRGGYQSRGADYDDDRRSGRMSRNQQQQHEHGGWYGDSEGHSEASRRGWQNRR